MDILENTTLPILFAPDPRLSIQARPVTPGDSARVAKLVPIMISTMCAARGIGLAAPQLGELLRLAVIAAGEDGDSLVLVNPTVVWSSPETVARVEGCLSIPGLRAEVTRPATVRVEFAHLDGGPGTLEATGLIAACIQHEIDHLDGILFTARISPLRRAMALKKLAKDRKGRDR